MSLGSRWQALLFLLLKIIFTLQNARILKRVVWIHWNMSFIGSTFFEPSILFIVYNCLSIKRWSEALLPYMTDGHKSIHVSSVVFSYGFSRQVTNTNIKNKWVSHSQSQIIWKSSCSTFIVEHSTTSGGGDTTPSFNTTLSQNGT